MPKKLRIRNFENSQMKIFNYFEFISGQTKINRQKINHLGHRRTYLNWDEDVDRPKTSFWIIVRFRC